MPPTLQTNYPVIRATASAPTPLPGGSVPTNINFDQIDITYSSNPQTRFNFDTANNQFVITQAGLYEIILSYAITFTGLPTSSFGAILDSAGTNINYASSQIPIISTITVSSISTVASIAANETLQGWIFPTGGATAGNISATSATVPVYFQLRYLGGIRP